MNLDWKNNFPLTTLQLNGPQNVVWDPNYFYNNTNMCSSFSLFGGYLTCDDIIAVMADEIYARVFLCFKNFPVWTSLAGQWFRIHLPMQGYTGLSPGPGGSHMLQSN